MKNSLVAALAGDGGMSLTLSLVIEEIGAA